MLHVLWLVGISHSYMENRLVTVGNTRLWAPKIVITFLPYAMTLVVMIVKNLRLSTSLSPVKSH